MSEKHQRPPWAAPPEAPYPPAQYENAQEVPAAYPNAQAVQAQGAFAPAPSSSPLPGPDVPAIEVTDVSRNFGAVKALAGATLSAAQGRVTALVGPNGCGKSTLMLMLAALLAPSAGTVRVMGHDPVDNPEAVRAQVGWMPDQFEAWDSLRVREVLEVIGQSYFMPAAAIRERVATLLHMLDLETLAHQSAHVLSRGQKQRLGLARALVHSPRVLVLDEPASGLDPAARRRLFAILRDFAANGGSVLISSHILSELEDMADAVVFMDGGHVIDQLSIADVSQRAQLWRIASLDEDRLRAGVAATGLALHSVIEASRTVNGHAEALVEVASDQEAARVLSQLSAAGVPVVTFGPATGRLESMYMQLDAAHRQGAL